MSIRVWVVITALAATALPAVAVADTGLAQARHITQAADSSARSSQKRIAQLDDQTQALLEKYRNALRQTTQLKAYVEQVQPLLTQQTTQIAALQKQLAQQGDIGQQILPLMLKMTTTLGEFVKLDLPFLKQERSLRIHNLKQAMADGSIALAGKFKRLAQAYRVEADYGRTLGVERVQITVGKQAKVVDVLRVGRAALLYETPSGDDTGYWDQAARRWVSLGGAYARDIREGLQIANDNLAAAPLPLPIPTATGASQ